MADTYREVERTRVTDTDRDVETVDTRPTTEVGRENMAVRIVSLIAGILMALLGMRFVLSLLGANRGNPFADFIYSVSHPFVAPFFGLFNYTPQFGVVRFEFETLIAMAFWAFVAWVIIQMIKIGAREQ